MKGQRKRTFCQKRAPARVGDWDIMNRQNAQYELKIIMTRKSLFSFAFLFIKNTVMPKVMEIVLANRVSNA